jgi:hypothetical protein
MHTVHVCLKPSSGVVVCANCAEYTCWRVSHFDEVWFEGVERIFVAYRQTGVYQSAKKKKVNKLEGYTVRSTRTT